LIFVNDVNKCYKLKLFLQQFFISAAVLNSEVPLNSRTHMLEEFNRGVFDYLIATDASIDQGEEEEADDDDDDEGEFEESDGEAGDNGEEVDEEDFDFGDDDEEEEQLEGEEDDEDEDDDEESAEEDVNESKGKVKRGRAGSSDPKVDPKKAGKGVEGKAAAAYSKRKANGDADYGVSRGIDFQGVSFVINFDFPATPASYTHRVGRTARGGASGTSLSFVTLYEPPVSGSGAKEGESTAARDSAVLAVVRSQQPRLGTMEGDNVLAAIGGPEDTLGSRELEEQSRMQPAQLNFNMAELESFRYRVEDTCRSVTQAAVKEFRTAELKREILNSTKLKAHFTENPNDLKVTANIEY
jgi:ATP-dependent RNA helicase DDX56/DBP9